MAKSGLKHIDVGNELTKTEWESEETHELLHGTSFPGSPVERQLFYRDDEHKWYIYNGSAWVWLGGGGGGGMEQHGNEYHTPDFATQADFLAHKTRHQDGGSDELSLAGLDGEPSELATHKALTQGVHGISSPFVIGHKLSARCKVYRSGTAQSIPEATNTKIQYNAEVYDTYNEFDSSTNYRFTPTAPGWYLILGCYQVELSMDGAEFAHMLFKNGAELALHVNTTGMVCWGIQGVFYLVYCNGTDDYLEFYAWQQKPGGGAKNLTASQSRNFVEIFLLSNM